MSFAFQWSGFFILLCLAKWKLPLWCLQKFRLEVPSISCLISHSSKRLIKVAFGERWLVNGIALAAPLPSHETRCKSQTNKHYCWCRVPTIASEFHYHLNYELCDDDVLVSFKATGSWLLSSKLRTEMRSTRSEANVKQRLVEPKKWMKKRRKRSVLSGKRESVTVSC